MQPMCLKRFAEPWGAAMATEVKLPRLGQGMESGTIVKWLKSEGDPVEKGEPLYELDTDKVTQEVEADFSGVLLKIAVKVEEVPEFEERAEEEGAPGAEREPERGREASFETETEEVAAPVAQRDGGRVK